MDPDTRLQEAIKQTRLATADLDRDHALALTYLRLAREELEATDAPVAVTDGGGQDERALADVESDLEDLQEREEHLDALVDRAHDALDATQEVRYDDSDLVDDELTGALSAVECIIQFAVLQALNEAHHGIHHERKRLRRERREIKQVQEGKDG